MFRCQACKELSKKREPLQRIVVEQRSRQYTNAGLVTTGWEIVKELGICQACFNVAIQGDYNATKR